MAVDDYKRALQKFITDEEWRKQAAEYPNIVSDEFEKLSRAEYEALRGIARVYKQNLVKVNEAFDANDARQLKNYTTNGDVYCCCCCCCGSEGLIRHM